MLIIGKRQDSYTLDKTLAKACSFDQTHIFGITELCREIMELDLVTLQAVHRKIADEQRRIRIELEPQLPDGTFQTSVTQFIEQKPSVMRSDASIFAAHADVVDLFDNADEARTALDGFIDELARLTRLTREFFGWMMDNAETRGSFGNDGLRVNADYLDAMCRNMPHYMAEIRLLTERGFIYFDQDEPHLSGQFNLYYPGTDKTNFAEAFRYFRSATGLKVTTLFSTMNFSPFGPSPVEPAAPKRKADKPKRRFRLKGLK